MDIKELQKNWDEFGRNDPLWAILTLPNKRWNKWQVDEFFETGVKEIDAVMKYVEYAQIGTVTGEKEVKIIGLDGESIIDVELDQLKQEWKKHLGDGS